MRVFQGKYGNDTLESNSLVANLLKYPEISKVIFQQYPQYSLTYFTDALDRYAKDMTIGASAYEWFVKGRRNAPSTCTGTYAGSGSGNATFTVEFLENYLNPNDNVFFYDQTQAIVQGDPVQTSGGWTYTFVLSTNSTSATIASSNFTAGYTAISMASTFSEGSAKGYGNTSKADKYRNHVTLSRKELKATADYIMDVTWIENNGHKVWYFTDHADTQDEFLYDVECGKWYNRTTMDSNGNCLVTDSKTGRPLIKGDGLLAQIDSSNTDTYTGDLTENRITDFVAQLKFESGMKDQTWMVYTGIGGFKTFEKAMKNYYVQTGSLKFQAQGGQDIVLGGAYNVYHTQGHKIMLTETPVFNDPNLHTKLAADGLPNESYKFVFTNFGKLENGAANIETIIKGSEGENRKLVIKYIPGMINPFDKNSMMAASPEDSFTVEWLTQQNVILRNSKSCGILAHA